MVEQRINLRRYGWTLTYFYGATSGCVDRIKEKLEEMHCPERICENMEKIAASRSSGMTYTSPDLHESVVVISRAICPADFANTLAHETQHVVAHMAKELGIDWESEEMCYLHGDISEATYATAHSFLCPQGACKRRYF